MNGSGKSYDPIRPEKPPNKGGGAPAPAEGVEERGSAQGNLAQHDRRRTQCRESLGNALDRVRQAAARDKKLRFTALWHHVHDVNRLRKAYLALKRDSAPGVDGETWQHYGEELETRLLDLSDRLKRGAYRPEPVRRVYIPKPDGRQRPIGVPALEDKIVQRATTEVLNAVYETDFLGFSYGFRPGRSQHNALDAVSVGIKKRKVNFVLDADISGFFDAIDWNWMVKFIEHRIADQRIVRHVKKWLHAGVLEDGKLTQVESGTPQGGSISPLMANVYLHYVLDLWVNQWRRRHANGDLIIVRFADDFVVGFEHRTDAERFRKELEERLSKFNLKLHPTKTRVIEFGRYAAGHRRQRSEGKPETFSFLGLTHICGKTRAGRFQVIRHTEGKRMGRKLKELKQELRKRLHRPVPEVGAWLRSVLQGHFRYYGVPNNWYALSRFRAGVARQWIATLRRRSQRSRTTWERMQRLARRWLPYPRIAHPYPEQRLRV